VPLSGPGVLNPPICLRCATPPPCHPPPLGQKLFGQAGLMEGCHSLVSYFVWEAPPSPPPPPDVCQFSEDPPRTPSPPPSLSTSPFLWTTSSPPSCLKHRPQRDFFSIDLCPRLVGSQNSATNPVVKSPFGCLSSLLSE